jgi:hypothetical protein
MSVTILGSSIFPHFRHISCSEHHPLPSRAYRVSSIALSLRSRYHCLILCLLRVTYLHDFLGSTDTAYTESTLSLKLCQPMKIGTPCLEFSAFSPLSSPNLRSITADLTHLALLIAFR